MTRRATGPITAKGKAVSSQNARKHGLNAPPDEILVSAWFNVILNFDDDALEEPNGNDPLREAALRLAIAEARYHRAQHKLETYHKEPQSAQSIVRVCYDHIKDLIDFSSYQKAFKEDPLQSVEYSMQILKLMKQIARREKRLRMRYLGEARAQRKKALRDWCAFNRDKNLNSRNELKLQSNGESA